MKWRHWSILIVLLLMNYLIFSTAFSRLSRQNEGPLPTRTPLPTFESVADTAVAWIVMPTNTPAPTRGPVTLVPTQVNLPEAENTTAVPAQDTPAVESTPTSAPAEPTVPADTTTHTVVAGEYLSTIAASYGVTVDALMKANGLANANLITPGQVLVIPAPAEATQPPTGTVEPQPTNTPAVTNPPAPTNTPAPKPTKKPPTPTPKPTARGPQFTAQVVWDPNFAPNCGGPQIGKQSQIRDAAGNPVNDLVVGVNCYGNLFHSLPSGTPGEYDPGHYGFGFNQMSPLALTCSAYILDANGQPLASCQPAQIVFDTNSCKPGGTGHQVATLNWTKHW
jgi:LysM repeat protein